MPFFFEGEHLTLSQHESRKSIRESLRMGQSFYTVKVTAALPDEHDFYIDTSFYRHLSRYFNSVCKAENANTHLLRCQIEGRLRLVFVTCRAVKAGSYLNILYRDGFDVGDCKCFACQ